MAGKNLNLRRYTGSPSPKRVRSRPHPSGFPVLSSHPFAAVLQCVHPTRAVKWIDLAVVLVQNAFASVSTLVGRKRLRPFLPKKVHPGPIGIGSGFAGVLLPK